MAKSTSGTAETPKPTKPRFTYMPLGDRILLSVTEKTETITDGGIVLPDTVKNKEPRKTGKVVAVGPGSLLQSGERSKIGVEVGDYVMVEEYHLTEIDEKQGLYMCREGDLHLKVIQEAPPTTSQAS